MADLTTSLDFVPAKMALVNLGTGERLDAQFNPENLEEALGAVYSKQKVPGLSHTVKQFSHTDDLVETFQLYFTANGRGEAARTALLNARRYLMSLCYPRLATSLGDLSGAPRVLFVWPGFISLSCVITSLKFKYPRMGSDGPPTIMQVDVTMEEIRDTLLVSEDVRDNGTDRGGT